MSEYTHAIYTTKREGPRGRGRLVRIGELAIGENPKFHFGQISVLPVGGFDGKLYIYPIDMKVSDAE